MAKQIIPTEMAQLLEKDSHGNYLQELLSNLAQYKDLITRLEKDCDPETFNVINGLKQSINHAEKLLTF